MPDLKRNVRLIRILGFLRGSRFRTVEAVAAKFDMSLRTAYRDVADLALAFPVERDDEGGGYRLSPDTELPPIALSVEETALLRALIEQPLLAHDAALRKIARSLGAKLARAIRALEETPAGLRLAPVDRSGPHAEQALAGLRDAIAQGRAVEIVYESLSGASQRPRARGLEPWEVFHRGGAWYVVGLCRVHREPRLFRLDRISAVGILGETARRPEEFDLERFLGGSWEVFFGPTRHDVVLEFDGALAPLVANARHHEGEATRRLPSGAIEYRVTLNALDEVARWIVGFGGGVAVVAPDELRRRVLTLARGTLEANEAGLRAQALRTRTGDRPAPVRPGRGAPARSGSR